MDRRIDSQSSFNNDFHRALIKLVIPIMLQNLISAAVNSVDIFMLGMVDQSIMSAISLAGQITFIIIFFYSGLGIGAGILTAQYWGKNDTVIIQRILSIACILSVIVSLIFFIISVCFPAFLMHIFTNDATLIAYGTKYQQVIALSYLVMSLSQMYLSVAKSMEKVRFCAIVSSACLILNIILNIICIFILFPNQPEKALVGVAVTTVIARTIELACCVIHSRLAGNIRFALPIHDSIQKMLFRDYVRYTIPALANYMVYGCALVASIAIIGHVSSDMVAANAIVNVVRNLAIVLCGGISAGGSVLIGKFLGNGDLQSAKEAGIRIYKYALFFGITACFTVLLLKPLVFSLVQLNSTAQEFLDVMLIICAFYCIGKSLNSTVIGGIFCAGGDAKFGFWCDVIVMWGIIIPLAYVCAFVWQVSPIILYIVICFDEIIKMPIALIRFRKYRWLNNITRDLS